MKWSVETVGICDSEFLFSTSPLVMCSTAGANVEDLPGDYEI